MYARIPNPYIDNADIAPGSMWCRFLLIGLSCVTLSKTIDLNPFRMVQLLFEDTPYLGFVDYLLQYSRGTFELHFTTESIGY